MVNAIAYTIELWMHAKSKCGLSWSVLLPTTSTCHYSFPHRLPKLKIRGMRQLVYIENCMGKSIVKKKKDSVNNYLN